jgi:hypothetical protein
MDAERPAGQGISRRSALKRSAGVGLLLTQVAALEQVAVRSNRALADVVAPGAAPSFSDIQFDIGNFINAPQTFNDGAGNVTAQFAPVFSLFQPLTLNRTPSTSDQTTFANALSTIEEAFPASPAGLLIVSVSYGLPYFNRLNQSVVKANIPTDLASGDPVLIEAVPFDTDVVGGVVGGPDALFSGVKKVRFNVDVTIEKNDMLLHTRSDNLSNLSNANAWLQGSDNLNGSFVPSPNFKGLFNFQTSRVQFLQQGMPQKVAKKNGFEFAGRMNPDSPMAMGFVDQQTDSSGPAAIVTFAGNASAVLTSAKAGDYFDNGSIAHLSHVIQDLYAFFASTTQEPAPANNPAGEPFTERVQYMFRSNQTGTADGLPADGNSDQFTNAGGPAFINNVFQGTGAALAEAQDSAGTFTATNATLNATFTGLPRIGHEEALQQVSRASDGTPLHVRMDGPGFDSLDMPAYNTAGVANAVSDGVFATAGTNIPAGSNMFKLEFLMFIPTAQLFASMRNAAAAQKLAQQFGVQPGDNGLERFLTATRRQNFLVPPRRHRSFPLVELKA